MADTPPNIVWDRNRSVLVNHVTRILSAAAADPHPALLGVQGDAGQGKSQVLADIRDRLTAQGIAVLSMTGRSVTAEMPYASLFELLVNDAPHDAARGLIDELSSFRPTTSPLAVSAAVMSWIHQRGGARPLVVIADDADLIDEDSLRVLAYAAVRDRPSAVSVLHAATRPVPLLDRLLVQQFTLDDLDDDDALEVATAAGAAESDAVALVRAFGGNPLALVHGGRCGVRQTADGHPEVAGRLMADVRQRLAHRAPDTVRLLEGAAITGVALLKRLEAMTAPCERTLDMVADEIEGTGMADVEGDGVFWRRRWMRTAVVAQCPTGRRRRWAERAAQGIEPSRDTPRVDGVPPELTAAELRVVEVIVAGSSTRQAATRLYLSEKTVESHLQAVYRKLGVHSRVQLAAAVHGGGLLVEPRPSSMSSSVARAS